MGTQCNKNKPIYLMWGEAGLHTGADAVLLQMCLVEQDLGLACCKCLLAMLPDAPSGSGGAQSCPTWRVRCKFCNPEKMLIVVSSKNVTVHCDYK